MRSVVVALITGFCQVALVAFQMRQISRGANHGKIFLTSCAISSVWLMNVRAALGGLPEGVAYVLGAGLGSLAAMKVRMK